MDRRRTERKTDKDAKSGKEIRDTKETKKRISKGRGAELGPRHAQKEREGGKEREEEKREQETQKRIDEIRGAELARGHALGSDGARRGAAVARDDGEGLDVVLARVLWWIIFIFIIYIFGVWGEGDVQI